MSAAACAFGYFLPTGIRTSCKWQFALFFFRSIFFLHTPLSHVSDEKGPGETRSKPTRLHANATRSALRKTRKLEVLKKATSSKANKRQHPRGATCHSFSLVEASTFHTMCFLLRALRFPAVFVLATSLYLSQVATAAIPFLHFCFSHSPLLSHSNSFIRAVPSAAFTAASSSGRAVLWSILQLTSHSPVRLPGTN